MLVGRRLVGHGAAVERQRRADGVAAGAARAGGQAAAVQDDALADPHQRPRRARRAVVADEDLERVGGEAQAHLGAAGAAVLERGASASWTTR